jgi:L-fuconolactonase
MEYATQLGAVNKFSKEDGLRGEKVMKVFTENVLVQAMNSYEDTVYMLKVAAERNWVGAVVDWVPLNIPEVAYIKLQGYTQNPYLKGVRHLIHEEKVPDWVLRDSVIEGLKILTAYGSTFDVVGVFPNHL